MKGTIVALAIHGLARMNAGDTGRPVVHGHPRLGKIASVTKIGTGTGTGTGIETGTEGETDGNGIETVNGIANGTVTTAIVWIMSDRVVDLAHLAS